MIDIQQASVYDDDVNLIDDVIKVIERNADVLLDDYMSMCLSVNIGKLWALKKEVVVE